MSDLRPTGAPVTIGGQEYNILFTIGAIEAIQETCNKALVNICLLYTSDAADE